MSDLKYYSKQQKAIIEIFTNTQTSRNFVACFPPNFGKTTALQEVIRRDMKTFGQGFKPIILHHYWHYLKKDEWDEFEKIAAIRYVPLEMTEEQIKSLEHWIDENTPGHTRFVLYTDNSFENFRKLDPNIVNKKNILARKHVMRSPFPKLSIPECQALTDTVLVTVPKLSAEFAALGSRPVTSPK